MLSLLASPHFLMALCRLRLSIASFWSVNFVITLLSATIAFGVADVQASAGGRDGFSDDPATNGGANCSVCHAPDGATLPVVSIVGPDTVSAGEMQNLYVPILGGPAQTVGINISVENGFGELLPYFGDLQALRGELTHTMPKNFRAGWVAFIILESDSALVYTPFLNIIPQVDSTGSEQGLLGLAFHPDYVNNGYFYVYYSRDLSGAALDRLRVSRFTVSSDPNVADASSELVLLEFEQPFGNHNGGDLHFGPDGYLHIAVGDGCSGGDPQNKAQTTTTLLGKTTARAVPVATRFLCSECAIPGALPSTVKRARCGSPMSASMISRKLTTCRQATAAASILASGRHTCAGSTS